MRALSILKSMFITHSPLILTHRVTSLCNCKCDTCDLWKKSSEYKDDLSKEKIFEMLKDAKTAGMIGYSVWGGEPLLRKDLPEILQFAKKLKFMTMVITNGFFLKERHKEISPFTDFLAVSIDANDDLHDRMRGRKGVRKRAIEGIKLCKNSKMKIIINSVISKLNVDRIEDLLDLSKELDVLHTFEPMDINEDYFKPNQQLRLSKEERQTVFSKIIKFKKAGYRIGNSTQYLHNFSYQKEYTCHSPKISITVDAHGTISSCVNTVWGNITNRRFKEIFESQEFKEFCKKAEQCNKCDVSCVIELSLSYSWSPSYLLDKAKTVYF